VYVLNPTFGVYNMEVDNICYSKGVSKRAMLFFTPIHHTGSCLKHAKSAGVIWE
jgi:hypothetical protein